MNDVERLLTEQGHTINRLQNEVAALHEALEVNKRKLEECADGWAKDAAAIRAQLTKALQLVNVLQQERDAWKVQALNHSNPE